MPQFSCSAILFDLDGVLVDSTGSVDRQWRAWARLKGIDEEKIIAIAHGVRALEVIQRVAPHFDAPAEVRELEKLEVKDQKSITAMSGALTLLQSLPDGRWGVVTSGSRDLASGRLRSLGLPVPKVLVTADDVTHGKPDPEPYLKGASLLRLNPSECLVIEDAPAGIQSAHAGGMKVIALASTYRPAALRAADAIAEKLQDVRVALNGDGKLTVAAG